MNQGANQVTLLKQIKEQSKDIPMLLNDFISCFK